jgi:hypothetical protein
MQLFNPYFSRFLQELRERNEPELTLEKINIPSSALPSALDLLLTHIDERLRSLNPQYRSKPKGYQLPIPRIQPNVIANPGSRKPPPDPMEIRDALKVHQKIVVKLPRIYPDQSLPWLLASDLITHIWDDRQIIPIVVEGTRIRQPRGTLAALSPIDLALLRDTESKVVFIIDEIPLESDTGIGLLKEEISQYPNAGFVLFTRDDERVIARTEFSRAIGADMQNLCPISFAEMATWVQAQFEIPSSDAEVIAVRLRNLFQRFRLPAHPTFFAGIPEEVFNAILQANRRAELIQLAVDGFLSFIVASDKQPVRLSRTTRARFLRALAYQIRVEKRTFTRDELIAFAREFADLHDLPMQAPDFIGGFIDHGIIVVYDDQAKISLPFIEAYLLAVELGENSEQAAKYFDPSDPDFDSLTFDLFAELSTNRDVTHQVMNSLNNAVDEMTADDAAPVLLPGKAYPKFIRNPDRLAFFENRIRSAYDAVQRGASDKAEKQRLLDMADYVQEKVFSEQPDDDKFTSGLTDSDLDRHVRAWYIATILLGQGVERLTRSDKDDLIDNLLKGGDLIVERWSAFYLRIDFDSLKEEMRMSSEARDIIDSERTLPQKAFEAVVDGYVDFMEFALLIHPVRTVFYQLSEQARHGALGPALERATQHEGLAELLRASWLADIDIEKGRKPLQKAVQDLPQSPLLRYALSSHFFLRAFWSQSRKKAKLAFLDLCEAILKPLDRQIPKGEFKRLIEAESKDDDT